MTHLPTVPRNSPRHSNIKNMNFKTHLNFKTVKKEELSGDRNCGWAGESVLPSKPAEKAQEETKLTERERSYDGQGHDVDGTGNDLHTSVYFSNILQ